MEDLIDHGSDNSMPSSLPNATGALVLGIISIATCWLYGLPGVVCGIIAIALHRKDKKTYLSNPSKYEASFKTSKAGFVCGIIGLCLSALMLVYFLIILVFISSAGAFSRF